jgi:pyrimidine operon attenuation protein/uracil phosphoribosyltransferase
MNFDRITTCTIDTTIQILPYTRSTNIQFFTQSQILVHHLNISRFRDDFQYKHDRFKSGWDLLDILIT